MGHTLTMSRPLMLSLAAIAITALVVLGAMAPPLAVAVLTPGVQENLPQHEIARLVKQHEAQSAMFRDRFDGRSVFFPPPAIRTPTVAPPPRPETPIVSTPKPPSGPPPAPPNYRGPTPTAIIGDEVHFVGDQRLRVGEESDGVGVISVDAPWSVKLTYAGGTYDVPLFEQVGDSLFGEGTARRTSLPGIVEQPTPSAANSAVMPSEPPPADNEDDEDVDPEEVRINPDGDEEDDEANEVDDSGSAPQAPEDQPRDIPDE